jgi:hypothetical protein
VSFSLYGDKDIYNCGALANAAEIPKSLPGWRTVFYLGGSVSPALETSLRQLGATTFRVDGAETPLAMTWRFRAVFLDGVSHVLFRDCDSRITPREVSCISQWIDSGKSYHIIRDHPWHASPIMGGLWGVAGRTELSYVGTVLPKKGSGLDDTYGLDQRLVSNAIYPRALSLNSYLVHDAFRSRERGRLRPPPRENGSFMGERVFCDGSYEEAERLAVVSHERSSLKRIALYISDFGHGRVGGLKSRRHLADKPTEYRRPR